MLVEFMKCAHIDEYIILHMALDTQVDLSKLLKGISIYISKNVYN